MQELVIVCSRHRGRRILESWQAPVSHSDWMLSREQLARKAARWGGRLAVDAIGPQPHWRRPDYLASNMKSQREFEANCFREYRDDLGLIPWGINRVGLANRRFMSRRELEAIRFGLDTAGGATVLVAAGLRHDAPS